MRLQKGTKQITFYLVLFMVLCCVKTLLAQDVQSDTTLVSPNAAENASVQDHDALIQKVTTQNILLKKAAHKLEQPLTGVEEMLRKEKIKVIIERINRNLSKIEKIKRDYARQTQTQPSLS